MACRIIRDANKEVVSVLAPNGEPSQLFADIMVDVQDTEKALTIYKDISNTEVEQLSLDNNTEVSWNDVRLEYIPSEVSKVSIGDPELIQSLFDNGYLNCE